MPDAHADLVWRDLFGTRSSLANNIARLAYGTRSFGLIPTVVQAFRRTGRTGGANKSASLSVPPADIVDVCSWLEDLPELERTERRVSASELASFMSQTDYPRFYYRSERRVRYALWHHTGLQLAVLSEKDVILDAGAQDGIWGRIARRRHRCIVYEADLRYPCGVHGRRIGCEVGSIPLPDESLTGIVSFCAFNCFEGDTDQAFLCESSRLLRPGGRLVIVPLCIADEYVNLYDPAIIRSPDHLDERARHLAWDGWGSNFGRWYDRKAFQDRFLNNLAGMAIRIERVKLAQPADSGVRDFYAAVCTKAST